MFPPRFYNFAVNLNIQDAPHLLGNVFSLGGHLVVVGPVWIITSWREGLISHPISILL